MSMLLTGCGVGGSGAAASKTPDQVAGLTFFLDPDQEAYANSDPVPTINDRSGNNYDTTSTGAYRPTFLTNQINGHSVYDFDGVDMYSDGSTAISNIITNSAYTILVVWKSDALTASGSPIYNNPGLICDAAGGYFGIYLKNDTPTANIYNWDTDADSVGQGFSTTGYHYLIARHDGGNLYISVDGAAETSAASGNTGQLTQSLRIGKNYADTRYFDGKLAYAAIWNTVVSGSDRDALIQGVKTRFGL